MQANEEGYRGAEALTVGSTYTARRAVGIVCTVAGNVSFKMTDDSDYVVPVDVGFSIFPFAVKGINTSGTTATATYANLK